MLEVQGLNAWYGESHILHGVDFEVREGEVVTLLGRNGAGKTTTLKSIMGLVPRREGSVLFRGAELTRLAPHHIARHGVTREEVDEYVVFGAGFRFARIDNSHRQGRLVIIGSFRGEPLPRRVFGHACCFGYGLRRYRSACHNTRT